MRKLSLTPGNSVVMTLQADGLVYNDRYPRPSVTLTGEVDGSETVRYESSSWGLVRQFSALRNELPASVRLSLDTTEFLSKAGDKISYTRPHVQVLR